MERSPSKSQGHIEYLRPLDYPTNYKGCLSLHIEETFTSGSLFPYEEKKDEGQSRDTVSKKVLSVELRLNKTKEQGMWEEKVNLVGTTLP